MPTITDATETWSSGVVLAAKEFWQVSEGAAARFTTDVAPTNTNQGAFIPLYQGLEFASGATVYYRRATAQPCTITRTLVA
jgi:hypothetical protein